MNTRKIAHYAGRLAVATAIANVVRKSLVANAPRTQKLHIAEFSGGVVGWATADHYGTLIDGAVDSVLNRVSKPKLRSVK